jgi:alkylresorcinol/alkylpyrone synthase
MYTFIIISLQHRTCSAMLAGNLASNRAIGACYSVVGDEWIAMAVIIGIGTAVPPYEVPQELARDFALKHFWDFLPHAERMASVFEHTRIDKRYFVVPNAWWFDSSHSLKEKNDLYIHEAAKLGKIAITRALESCGLAPQDVANFLFVSSTGIAAPSLDARLINDLHMRPDVRRTPIWGLGCAGGVAGLARAAEIAKVYPDEITLLLTVETCGLNFQFEDMSKKNFVTTSLFGDGAAAVVLTGDRGQAAPKILDSQSTLWPDSLGVMGWEVGDRGLGVIFGSEIPRYVADYFRPEVDRFLNKHGLFVQHIDHLVFHPGGAKVLESYYEALDLTNGHLTPSYEVLRNYGNMSSPTVLFVLDYIQTRCNPQPGQYGLAAALGPGFSAEQVLLQF